jgi:hypothetical protein
VWAVKGKGEGIVCPVKITGWVLSGLSKINVRGIVQEGHCLDFLEHM